ncbi:MAG: hypothetical protein ACYC3I_25085, partial [Gemmataceae bacterium]
DVLEDWHLPGMVGCYFKDDGGLVLLVGLTYSAHVPIEALLAHTGREHKKDELLAVLAAEIEETRTE